MQYACKTTYKVNYCLETSLFHNAYVCQIDVVLNGIVPQTKDNILRVLYIISGDGRLCNEN